MSKTSAVYAQGQLVATGSCPICGGRFVNLTCQSCGAHFENLQQVQQIYDLADAIVNTKAAIAAAKGEA
jgi:hypothetical protein